MQSFAPLAAALLGVLSGGDLIAQDQLDPPSPVIDGEVRTLRTASGLEVRLEVRLPASYALGSHRYPVLYVLDPDGSMTGTQEGRHIPRPPGMKEPDLRITIRATRADAKK
jgi:hypothetical protein